MKILITLKNSLLVATLLAAASQSTHAQGVSAAIPLEVDMGGNTQYDGWYNLSSVEKEKVVHGNTHTFAGNSGYPSFFTSTNAWPSPIYSQLSSDENNSASLGKVSNGGAGGPYPASDSMYFASFGGDPNTYGGTLGVSESSPLADLGTIVFQVQIGEAWTYDFYDDPEFGLQVPTLTLDYGVSESITLQADISETILKVYNGSVEMPSGTEDVYINLYGYQWDVSEYDNISSYLIEFSAVEHAQLYALQLDQSSIDYGTTSVIPAIPEPHTYALFLGSALLLGSCLYRRRKPLSIPTVSV